MDEINKDKLIATLMDILKAERIIKHVETEAMKRVRENREARQKERLRTLSKKLTASDKPS